MRKGLTGTFSVDGVGECGGDTGIETVLGVLGGGVEVLELGGPAGDALVGLSARAGGALGGTRLADGTIEEVIGVTGGDAGERGSVHGVLACRACRALSAGGAGASITETVALRALVGGWGVELRRTRGAAGCP